MLLMLGLCLKLDKNSINKYNNELIKIWRKILFIRSNNAAGVFVKPNGITRNSKYQYLVLNAVFKMSSDYEIDDIQISNQSWKRIENP